MNTKFNYTYCDGGNYKVHNDVVLVGRMTDKQLEIIKNCLSDGEYFIPSQVGLPEKRFEKWDSDSDHSWFEFDDIEFVGTPASAPMTIEQLVANFQASKGNWDDVGRLEELTGMPAAEYAHYAM